MNLDDVEERLDLVDDLIHYANSIIDGIIDDPDINDWRTIHVFREKLFELRDLIAIEYGCYYTLCDMNDMKQSDEDSKWTFPLEKFFNDYVKRCFWETIEVLVNISRAWKFNDYRARNFQNELRQKMEMLRDWYAERYELND